MRSVALLRGINVGGNGKVDMKKLKAAFEAMGFTSVKTYINSGNVLFDHKKQSPKTLATNIQPFLKKMFGFEINVVVCEEATLKHIAESIPASWKNDETTKTDVMFLWDGINNKGVLEKLKINTEVDRVIYVPGALLWNINRKDFGKSGMSKIVGTLLYKQMTIRNVNTTRKLAELLST